MVAPRKSNQGVPCSRRHFSNCVSGPVLAARMDLGLLTEVSKAEEKRIEASENKLTFLGSYRAEVLER